MQINDLLSDIGIECAIYPDGDILCRTPIDGSNLAYLRSNSTKEDVDRIFTSARYAFEDWRSIPAPKRGELVRLFADEVRCNRKNLAQLVAIETGKTLTEADGEVQEVIDICDFSVGLSRQLYGLTIATERPLHRMMEQWHPLGIIGVVSAFNFPVAVWAWNSALALVCGNSVVWKPSEKTTLSALAANQLLLAAARKMPFPVPPNLNQVLIGGHSAAMSLASDRRIALLSATGSTEMGRCLAPVVAARFGRSLLELGGNNAIIVTAHADLNLAVRSIAFGAWGTSGQRCTTTRRVLAHVDIVGCLTRGLETVRNQLLIGNPLSPNVLLGPLINEKSFFAMQDSLNSARAQGAQVFGGERVHVPDCPDGWYVRPALVLIGKQTDVVMKETFAPILYVISFQSLKEAVALNNAVDHGLSSSIFTNNLLEAECFMSAAGSDCGIVNVNIGTSGAEIGGAFGGEKDTGGGRESGSDAWRNYMRRSTNTINYSADIHLAQNVVFDV
jgi:aldehyde dehydrogenase (NAD+)